MPELRPFRGLRYHPALTPDVTDVLCPPYDVISVEQRERLLARSPANAVRLELPAATTGSATARDISVAAETLAGWIADGTLRRDEVPMIYVYEQRFSAPDGTARTARSFFCRLRLEEYGPDGGVLPHERTLAGPREHRFQLLSAVRTHLSPVLLMYEDGPGGAGSAVLMEALTTRTPDVDSTGGGDVGERLWAVDPSTSEAAAELLRRASSGPLFIADGHHRYETALRYRDTDGAPPDAAFVLALLYEAGSGGLQLAPWHRVISGVPDPGVVLARAGELYAASPVGDPARLVEDLGSSGDAGTLTVWTRAGGAILHVDRARVAPLMSGNQSEEVRWLDVSVLSGTLGPMTGASEQELTHEGRLSYTHDAWEAMKTIEEGQADVCFLLRPTPVQQVLAVARAGEFMPAKSTYFYPKASTGLVFDPLYE